MSATAATGPTGTVLVIGGTRFVGPQVVARLLARGDRVTLLNRGTHEDPWGDRVERLRADRRTGDLERVLAGRSFAACVDFAAYDGGDVARAIAALGDGRCGHYVLVSSGQVYLVREGAPRPSREGDFEGPVLPRPTDPDDLGEWEYGVGKREAEGALVAAATRLPATRLRIPVIHGERDPKARLLGYWHRILDGGPLLLPSGGVNVARHVHARSVALAIVACLGNPRALGKAYNVSTAEAPTLAELVGALASASGGRARIVPAEPERLRAAGLDPALVSPLSGRWQSQLDGSLFSRELGFVHEPTAAWVERVAASFLALAPAPPEGYGRRAAELVLARRWG